MPDGKNSGAAFRKFRSFVFQQKTQKHNSIYFLLLYKEASVIYLLLVEKVCILIKIANFIP